MRTFVLNEKKVNLSAPSQWRILPSSLLLFLDKFFYLILAKPVYGNISAYAGTLVLRNAIVYMVKHDFWVTLLWWYRSSPFYWTYRTRDEGHMTFVIVLSQSQTRIVTIWRRPAM